MKLSSIDSTIIRHFMFKFLSRRTDKHRHTNYVDKYYGAAKIQLWKQIVDKTVERYKDTKKGLLIHKRFVLLQSPIRISTDLFIDRSTYYCWQHDIYEYVFLLAVSQDLLRMRENLDFDARKET